MSISKIFAVDKFLGINQSGDGSTELKTGEAAMVENFTITDGGNLKLRPGVSILKRFVDGQKILCLWQGTIGQHFYLVSVYTYSKANCQICVQRMDTEEYDIGYVALDPTAPIKAFPLGDRLYIAGTPLSGKTSGMLTAIFEDETESMIHFDQEGYVPLAITGCAPAGGGTMLEPLNILSTQMRVQFSSDGAATGYVLPDTVLSVTSVTVDGAVTNSGNYSAGTHTYTFTKAPAKGVGNVEFLCNIENTDLTAAVKKFCAMPFSEAFNGGTDTRVFFYGDGTNICYYTGAPTYGQGLYLPAGNEIAVDATASAVTAMCRDYSRLLAFKPDSAFSITYEPVTLADGSVIAGFTVRPVHRDLGCDVPGQVHLVNNYPRTVCRGGIYDWKIASYSYRDERYARCVSDRVRQVLSGADLSAAVACDDTTAKTYYFFLNDDSGTVLVHRYELDVWTIYSGEVFRNIRYADARGGSMLFASNDSIYLFDPENSYDISTVDGGDPLPISAVWESGHMSFGAAFRRKYSSTIWLSLLPEAASNMDITVSTDRREAYQVKNAGYNMFGFASMDFSDFTFFINPTPKIKRIRIKVKKFVYYKMIFRVSKPGARATILGYDQQVRFSSLAK